MLQEELVQVHRHKSCGGLLATRYRPKQVLAGGVAIWSLCTITTPLAAASGHVEWLLACRTVMGVGEGVTFPCIQNLVASNVPDSSKPRSLSTLASRCVPLEQLDIASSARI
jgi:MFS family permease